MRAVTAAILSLLLVGASARHGHRHGTAYHNQVDHRGLEVEIVTVTEIVTQTVFVDTSSALATSTSAVHFPDLP